MAKSAEIKPIAVSGIEQLPEAAARLLPQVKTASVVAFYGQMGAGKTTLIKELCRQLEVNDVVNSPTFSLVNEYHTQNGDTVYHFDFYRINKLEEVYDFGYEEYFYSGSLCLIEWPELIADLLPEDTLEIAIKEQADGSRIISSKR